MSGPGHEVALFRQGDGSTTGACSCGRTFPDEASATRHLGDPDADDAEAARRKGEAQRLRDAFEDALQESRDKGFLEGVGYSEQVVLAEKRAWRQDLGGAALDAAAGRLRSLLSGWGGGRR